MATKFIRVLLSNNILNIRYSKICMLYHITYTTIEALLCQPQRIILNFESNRSKISIGRKHCKYDMHIHFHASFLGISFKSFIDDKTILHKVFVRTIDSLYVLNLYKFLPSTCYVLLFNFQLMCKVFVFCLKKQDIFF